MLLGADLTDDQKSRIQDKADEVLAQYDEWLGSLSRRTANMDSYVTASANNLVRIPTLHINCHERRERPAGKGKESTNH